MNSNNSLYQSANILITQIENTRTYDRNRFSNSVSADFRSLMGRGVINPEQIKKAIKNAVVETTKWQINHSSAVGQGGMFYYADHFMDPKALAYTLKYYYNDIPVDQIHFDHGQSIDDYQQMSTHQGDYVQYLYKKLLKPDPIIEISSSGNCYH